MPVEGRGRSSRRTQQVARDRGLGNLATPKRVQKLQMALHAKAKAEAGYRFYALYDKIYREDVLAHAYAQCRSNRGAPGVDRQDFAEVEAYGVQKWLGELALALRQETYRPDPIRRVFIPKANGKLRPLGISTLRDRVCMTAAMLVLEPIFEAALTPEQYAYRPGRNAQQAVVEVEELLFRGRPEVVDADLADYFDNVRHDRLLAKVAQRVDDADVMHLLKTMLKTNGKRAVPQGGVISPLLSNIYLTDVDRMLEQAKETTREGKYTNIEYARFADDLVILIDAHPRHDWLTGAVEKRLREELAKLQVEINDEKSRIVDLSRGESFGFLGFDFRRIRSRRGVWRAYYTPKLKKRTALLRKLKEVFRRYQSQPVDRVVQVINPILSGWVNYFAIGDASECFAFIMDWVEKKIRRHMMRARKRKGCGWKRWSRGWLYEG